MGRQVREKEDRHQQRKMDGFLRPRAAMDAATSPSAAQAPDVDMEVNITYYSFSVCCTHTHLPWLYKASWSVVTGYR